MLSAAYEEKEKEACSLGAVVLAPESISLPLGVREMMRLEPYLPLLLWQGGLAVEKRQEVQCSRRLRGGGKGRTVTPPSASSSDTFQQWSN